MLFTGLSPSFRFPRTASSSSVSCMRRTAPKEPRLASLRRGVMHRPLGSQPNAEWRAPAPKRPCEDCFKSTQTYAAKRDGHGSSDEVPPGKRLFGSNCWGGSPRVDEGVPHTAAL